MSALVALQEAPVNSSPLSSPARNRLSRIGHPLTVPRRAVSLPFNLSEATEQASVTGLPPSAIPPRTNSREAVDVFGSPPANRPRWLSSILQPSPSLPSSGFSPVGTPRTSEHVERDRRIAMREALDEVHDAQSDLLECLSVWAPEALLSTNDSPDPLARRRDYGKFNERVLFLGQALASGYVSDLLLQQLDVQEGEGALEELKVSAKRLCDMLEEFRDVARAWAAARDRHDRCIKSARQASRSKVDRSPNRGPSGSFDRRYAKGRASDPTTHAVGQSDMAGAEETDKDLVLAALAAWERSYADFAATL